MFEHSLDDKGRVVLPSKFRSDLANHGYITQYDQCLSLWTPEGFEDVANRLTEKVRAGEASQQALRAFSASAHQVKLDSQGRIGIPERLRQFAGIDGDVAIVGALDRVELWNADRWHQMEETSDQSLTQAVTELGL